MDEYNQNTQNNQNRNDNEEPRTPYQTPVRGSSSGGDQWQSNASGSGYGTYQGTGSSTGSTGGSSYSTNGNPYSQSSSGSGQSSRPNGSSNPYSQWGPSPNGPSGGKKPNRPNKPKGSRTGLKIAALAAVIAIVAFVGGMAAGGGLDDLNADSSAKQQTEQQDSADTSTSSKLQISTTKTTGNGEEADDGMTSTQIYGTVSPSIVSIIVDDMTVGSEASGSGVIMSKDGYVITNQHVVDGGNKFTVVTSDSTQYEAELIGEDEQTDLAVLKIDSKADLSVAEFGSSDDLAVGDRCYAIGSPGGVEFQNTFTGGFVSAINRDVTINDRVMTLIQTDAAINPGSSGGALINKYGQVVGITSSKLSSSGYNGASYEGMGFAIPMTTVQDIVNELIENGHVTGRPAIGISGYDITETTASYYDVPQGVLVSNVDESSDAYEQGIQANDIITKVNGKKITCMSDINEIKEELAAGDKMTLTIYRSGKTREITITLMDQADLSGTTPSSEQQQQQSGSNYYGYGYGNGNSSQSNPFSSFGY